MIGFVLQEHNNLMLEIFLSRPHNNTLWKIPHLKPFSPEPILLSPKPYLNKIDILGNWTA